MLHAPCPLLVFPLYASRDVESSERLKLLQRATGQTAREDAQRQANGQPPQSSSNFQQRLDSIYDQTAQPERGYVAREDARELQAMEMAKIQEELYEDEDSNEDEDEEEDKMNPFGKKDKTREKTKDGKSLLDASEEAFQEETGKMWEEEDKRRAERAAAAEEAEQIQGKRNPSAPPSLSNNPFYFAPTASAAGKRFEENKAVLVSRLVHSGIDEETASTYLSEASNEEELILKLMQYEDFTYGEASEVSQIESSEG